MAVGIKRIVRLAKLSGGEINVSGSGTNRLGNASSPQLTIKSNLGIKIESPATRLYLEGPVRVDGNIQASTTTVYGTVLPSQVTNVSNTSGSLITSSVGSLTLTTFDHGKIFLCNNSASAKLISLPANVASTDIGTQITIVQNANLKAAGALSMSAGASNTFSVNSYAMAKSAMFEAAQVPNGANNRVYIRGGNSHSSWNVGSTMVFTCVAANKWQFVIRSESKGTGDASAITLATV